MAGAVARLDQDRTEPREVVLTPHLIVRGTTAVPARRSPRDAPTP
ncbi:hypothetical protein ACWC0C_27845 [Streptomyces sp. NPDC001709]